MSEAFTTREWRGLFLRVISTILIRQKGAASNGRIHIFWNLREEECLDESTRLEGNDSFGFPDGHSESGYLGTGGRNLPERRP